MKNITLLLVLVSFYIVPHAQIIDTTLFITDNGDVLSADEKTLADDKMILKDQYDAVKKEIVNTRNNIAELERYSKLLDQYKVRLEAVSVGTIETTLAKITFPGRALSPEEQTAQAANEMIIYQELNRLDYGTDYFGDFGFQGQYYEGRMDADEMMTAFSDPLSNELNKSSGISKFMRFTDNSSTSELFFINATSVDNFRQALLGVRTRLNEVIQTGIGNEKNRIIHLTHALNKRLAMCQKISAVAKAKFNKKEEEINLVAIKWGLPLFCGTILALFVLPIILRRNRLRKGEKGEIECDDQHNGFQGIILETCTVLLVTATILILGLAGKLSNEVLGTLIGGISGYVLNRMRSKKDDDQNSSSKTLTVTRTPVKPGNLGSGEFILEPTEKI
ncbi:MAG TPA: hypothetical protein VK826_07620 [Bacteroidia bacterium]|nr:hypothetical protein [Bacteroidia bacterium]